LQQDAEDLSGDVFQAISKIVASLSIYISLALLIQSTIINRQFLKSPGSNHWCYFRRNSKALDTLDPPATATYE